MLTYFFNNESQNISTLTIWYFDVKTCGIFLYLKSFNILEKLKKIF